MRTRGLRRDAGFLRQFAGGERAAAEQRSQHVGAGGVADEGGDHGDIGTCFHSSILAEASTWIKGIPSWSSTSGVIASASEAIQSGRRRTLDCVVACAPRNDDGKSRRFP